MHIHITIMGGRGGGQEGKSPFSLLSEPFSPSSLNGYVSFSPSSLLFPPISPSSLLFLGHFSLLPILFLPPQLSCEIARNWGGGVALGEGPILTIFLVEQT